MDNKASAYNNLRHTDLSKQSHNQLDYYANKSMSNFNKNKKEMPRNRS